MLNKFILTGNVSEKVELRYTSTGLAIATAKINHTRTLDYKGERKIERSLIVVDAFGPIAEDLSKVQPREGVCVTGRMKVDQWIDDKTKQPRSKLKLIVESFDFLDGEPEGEPETETPRAKPAPEKPKSKADDFLPSAGDDEDSDVPF